MSNQSTTVATGNMSLNNAYLRGLTGANATALTSAPAPLSTDCGTFTHGFDFISGFLVSRQRMVADHIAYLIMPSRRTSTFLPRLYHVGLRLTSASCCYPHPVQALTSANSIPPPPRDDIGIPPHPHEAPASNLVGGSGVSAKDNTDQVFLQVSPSDPLSDLGLTPLDDALTSALVGISEDTS